MILAIVVLIAATAILRAIGAARVAVLESWPILLRSGT